MALADQVERVTTGLRGSPCSVGRALEKLPPGDLKLLKELLGTRERRGVDARVIFDAMQAERRELLARADALEAADEVKPKEIARLRELAEAYDVKLQTVNRHRGGGCRCES